MSLNIGMLEVERLIIHEIPRRTANQLGGLRVASIESPLDQTDKNFFAERIKESLSKSQFQAAFQLDTKSPVPKYIADILYGKNITQDNFVPISQSIATHLHGCQKGNNPSGVLVIAQVKVSKKPSLAILKIEKEEGVQYEPEEKEDGSVTYNIKQLSNLMMTGGKVFKAGLFVRQSDDEDVNSVIGYISDKQRSLRSNTEVAKFFLEDFLGCYLIESPELVTKAFFKACQDFINTQVEDPELKIKYEVALLAMIHNNDDDIDPVSFAQLNFDLDDRQNFMNCLESSIVPLQSFKKDINSIENNIKTIHFKFENNQSYLHLSGDRLFIKDSIKIQKMDNNRVQVTFEAELEKIGK